MIQIQLSRWSVSDVEDLLGGTRSPSISLGPNDQIFKDTVISMSRRIRNQQSAYAKTQIRNRGNRDADQRLCFH